MMGKAARVAILGDMGELGEDEAALHEGVGIKHEQFTILRHRSALKY